MLRGLAAGHGNVDVSKYYVTTAYIIYRISYIVYRIAVVVDLNLQTRA